MTYQVQSKEGLRHQVRFTLPQDVVQSHVDDFLNKRPQLFEIKGFRKGKAPKSAILARHKYDILTRLAEGLLGETFLDYVKAESVSPAARPEFTLNKLELEGIEFDAAYDILPEFEIPNLEKVELELVQSEIKPEDITRNIDILRKQRGTYSEVSDRACQLEDQVTIDFKGFKGGEPFEGGEAEGHTLTLGEGRMIPGFEDGIMGMKVGESKEISVKFPEDYGHEELKGQEATFQIKLHKIEQSEPSAIDEAFCKHFGAEDEKSFQTKFETQLQQELKRALSSKRREAAYDLLLEQLTFELPQSLIETESLKLRDQTLSQMRGGAKINPENLPLSLFEEEAKKRVRLGLAISQLVKQHEVSPSKEEVEAFIKERSADYEKPDLFFQHFSQDEERFNEMKNRLTDQLVIDKVLSLVKVTPKEVDFKTLVR